MRSTKSGPGKCSVSLGMVLHWCCSSPAASAPRISSTVGITLYFITAGGTEVPPLRSGERQLLHGGAVHGRPDHRVDRQRLFGFVDGVTARMRLGMPGCKQRARVLVGHDRVIEGAGPLRPRGDLF